MQTRFRDVGHPTTLFSAFLYSDMSFMVWVLLGPLGVQIGHTLHLRPAQLGFMVAVPVLSGALLRVPNGFLVDQFKPRRVAIAMQIGIMTGLVGMAAGIGGFYVASSLGLCKQLAGTYQLGFLVFAGIAMIAFAGITLVSRHWRVSWSRAALARV